MSLVAATIQAFEGAPLPDVVRRAAVEFLVANARRNLRDAPAGAEAAFAREMSARPIAEHTKAANDQHYELPAAFFAAVLGPQLKYSSCLYGEGSQTLAEAEEKALSETAVHAGLADGQTILELGCGWGSLSLWMARALPRARITSVSNSKSQGAFIRARAAAMGLSNLTVVTADMNDFESQGGYDRIVSVEMFEHMSNWRALLTRARAWLKPDGRMFIHVFTHKTTPYRFEVEDEADWIGQHFFSGGVMPSHDLIRQFPDLFEVEDACAGVGLTMRRPPWTGWPIMTATPPRSARCCARSMATRPSCGIAAGGCSSWPPPACSATGAAANGASATTA